MNWLNFWNVTAKNSNPKLQVGRMLNGVELTDDIIDNTAAYIINMLQINQQSEVLDVCCGNGLITNKVAAYCRHITGIDFSNEMIQSAEIQKKHNANFICENAMNFMLNKQFDAVYIAFSFQYFEQTVQAIKLLQNCLQHLKKGGRLLITDIPDAEKIFKYYNTPYKVFQLVISKILNNNNMGRFWNKRDLIKICYELQVHCQIIQQQNWQPYRHYRFDALIIK